MSQRKTKKRKAETRGEYLKRFGEEADRRLRGRVVTSWRSHKGRNVEVATQPPMTRKDIREMTFKLAIKRRSEPANDMGTGSELPHESAFTKPPLGTRRVRRRAAGHAARRARRLNRR
jgi:hypothetical protein